MKLVIGAIVSALLLVSSPAMANGELEELAARVKPSVVHITVHDAAGQKKGSGTGFFISEDGWIVTSDHVIEKASQVRIVMVDGSEQVVVGAIARDYDRDVAIIKVEGTGYPALGLDDSGSIPVGANVAVVGSPLGLSWTLSTGIVSAYRENGLPDPMRASHSREGGALLQITASFSPGSSGSPVLNVETGKVVGVAASIIRSGGELNFAVPIEAVQELMLTIGPDTQPESFSSLPLRNLIASEVFFALLGVGYGVSRRYRTARKTKG